MRWKTLLVLLLLPLAGLRAVTFTLPDTSVTAENGTLFSIPVLGDFGVGEGVVSFELELDFPGYWVVTGTDLTGGLLEGWGADFSFNPDGDALSVAAADDEEMAGSGILFTIQAEIQGSGWMSFTDAIVNEGAITPTLEDGYFTHTLPPTLAVYPSSAVELIIAETELYWVSGGYTPPLQWSVEDPVSGSVDAGGLFTALDQGTNRVHALDDAGLEGQGGSITIRTFHLEPGTVSGTAGETVILPIDLSNPASRAFSSYEFEVDLESSRFTLSGLETTGTLSETWSAVYSQQNGNRVRVAAAAAAGDSINAGGELIRLVIDTAPGGAINTSPDAEEAYFDEAYTTRLASGYISMAATNDFYLTPNTAYLKAGQTQLFTVVGTPNGPLTWGSFYPSVGTVDGAGLFTAHSGGWTKVHAVDPLSVGDTTGVISVYDVDVQVGSVGGVAGEPVLVPIITDPVHAMAVESWEFELDYDPALITFDGFEATGTLCDAWSEFFWNDEDGQLSAAAAGPEITDPGTQLVYMRFEIDSLAAVGAVFPLDLQDFLYNEGSPVVQFGDGQITVITAPLNLTITVLGLDARLDWNTQAGAAYYNVYRSSLAYSGWVLAATPATNTWTDSGVLSTDNQMYYYVTAEIP